MGKLYKNIIGLFIILAVSACDDKEYIKVNDSAHINLTVPENNLVLNVDNAEDNALTLSWAEPSYGYDAVPEYMIYFDIAGQNFEHDISISAHTDLEYTFTTKALNSILLNNLEVKPETPTDIEVKVEAILGDSYVAAVSDVQTINLTGYYTTLDLSTDWGVVGDATPNGWDGPDMPFYQTNEDNVYVAYTTLSDGEIKFRKDNAWDVNYGDNNADGTLEDGGANIAVTAGTYKITLDLNNLEYTIEEYSWGLVGSATPNGWDGPDIPLEYDPLYDRWTTETTLSDGELKFRLNNKWDLDYGDTDADGTLDQGGDNIAVTAGTYTITMDLNNLIYTVDKVEQ